MHQLLTNFERITVKDFIKSKGEKNSTLRGLATRIRQNHQQILDDLALMENFLKHYDEVKSKEAAAK